MKTPPPLDLFAPLSPAPSKRGAVRTSSEAGESMARTSVLLRNRVLGVLQRNELTADQVATALNESILAVRPRVSELHKAGKIVETGERRPNESGLRAAVWKAI